jgi:hypothetical protein
MNFPANHEGGLFAFESWFIFGLFFALGAGTSRPVFVLGREVHAGGFGKWILRMAFCSLPKKHIAINLSRRSSLIIRCVAVSIGRAMKKKVED